MRVPMIAASILTIATASPALAQHAPRAPMAPMAMPRVTVQRPMPMPRPTMAPRPMRWGNMVGGRWQGGHGAPGGWAAYRRPTVGWAMPRYWLAPSFMIYDWSAYGLRQPWAGYNWVRYYDDAVLVDGRGRVADSVSGIDWDGDYDVDAATYAQGDPHDGYAIGPDGQPPVAGAPYPPPGAPAPVARERDRGVGGALIGGAAGAVAGNLIAGRGNRTAGTLLGAGVGAVAGAVIDRAEDRGRRRLPPPPAGAPYPPPGAYYGQPYPGGPAMHHGGPVYQGNGVTVVTTGSPYGYGATTTVVTVQGQPTTTTSTEYVWETVGHVRKHRRVVRRCRCK